MVIFFRLINLPVIFQTMINKILQDLINTGKIASFINNIIIETETKEEHNELVEKVVGRLAESERYSGLANTKVY